MSAAQGVNGAALWADGLVDHMVDERDDAALEARAFCERMALAIEYELATLRVIPVERLLPARVEKYRALGRGRTSASA